MNKSLERQSDRCVTVDPVNDGISKESFNEIWNSEHLRAVQVAPDHPAAQVHVFGPVHVPPFWHADEQKTEIRMETNRCMVCPIGMHSTYSFDRRHRSFPKYRYMYSVPCTFHHSDMLMCTQLKQENSILIHLRGNKHQSSAQVPQVAPAHPETQLQTLGFVQVPPLAHTGEQTARMRKGEIS